MPHTDTPEKPELLAPAGSLEAFFAAVDAGADAIYTGLKDFSARAKAKNFSLADIERMTGYLHAENKRLYVTLNTLIREKELSHLIDTLSALESFAVDAVIIQDPAVWKLVREHFPKLELHASTQMTIHNVAGIKTLERLGFTRAVLARELTLAEITLIRSQTRLELEHFIHGALCFSFSGQCYFSSFLGGKSGNRGRCAQPCRRGYRHHQQQGFFFSPNDLSAIDLLPDLETAGICSFKIEGRMKSAEYVHKVVGAYRRVLDTPEIKRKKVLAEAKQQLKESFGRQPTRGFLAGRQPDDMAIPSQKGATGRFIGKVRQIQGHRLSFTSTAPLHLGDRLRIQPANDKSGRAFTLRQLLTGSRQVKKTAGGSQVTVISPFDQGFKPGDSIFMVASADAYTLSDSAARRKLDQRRSAGEPADLHISVSSEQINIIATLDQQTTAFTYPITSFAATHQPLDTKILRQVFAAVAQEPFTLNEFSCSELPAIVIPPKELKQIRRTFYRDLRLKRQEQIQQRRFNKRQAALDSLLAPGNSTPSSKQLRVLLKDTREQHLLNNEQVDSLLLPLNRQSLQHADKLTRRADKIIWDIPFILFDPSWKEYQSAVRALHENGFRRFRLNNLGHFPLFDGLAGLQLYSSYRLFALNSQAVTAWAELGIADVELYIEDDRDNLAAILTHKLPTATSLLVYGQVPLLTSRIQIRQLRGDGIVLSDRIDAYRVHQRQGLTWLHSDIPFSFIGNIKELEQLGCSGFIIDLSHCGSSSPTGRQVLNAVAQGIDPDNCSKFNFSGGLE
ncbi:MAG: peptidase U32 family protein [Pelovirga sp.]